MQSKAPQPNKEKTYVPYVVKKQATNLSFYKDPTQTTKIIKIIKISPICVPKKKLHKQNNLQPITFLFLKPLPNQCKPFYHQKD